MSFGGSIHRNTQGLFLALCPGVIPGEAITGASPVGLLPPLPANMNLFRVREKGRAEPPTTGHIQTCLIPSPSGMVGKQRKPPPPPPPCDWAGSLATNTAASWLLPQPGQCQGRFRQGWGEETRSGSTHTGLIQACNYHNSPRVAWVSAPPLGARTSTPRRPQYPSWETVTPGCGWWRRKGWPWEDGGRGAPGALDLGLEVISCLSYKNRCAVKPRQRLKAGLFSRGLK